MYTTPVSDTRDKGAPRAGIQTEQWGPRLFELIRTMVSDLGSQTEVARRTGLSPSYVSKIVRGEASADAVKLATIDTVTAHLELPDGWLLHESFEPTRWREESITNRADAFNASLSPHAASPEVQVDPRAAIRRSNAALRALANDALRARGEAATEAYRILASVIMGASEVVLAAAILRDDEPDPVVKARQVDLLGRALAALIVNDHDLV